MQIRAPAAAGPEAVTRGRSRLIDDGRVSWRERRRVAATFRGSAMFVNDMLCDWVKGRPWGKDPSWEAIEAAIQQLDGRTRTEVSIAGAGEAHMSITGGGGFYLVSATPNNDVFHDLRNP